MEFDRELDLRGFFCPIPIIKTKVAMDKMPPGQVLKVISTDAGSLMDMPAFSKETGHSLLHAETVGTDYIFFLRKAGPSN